MGERFPTQLHVCVCVCVCFYITVQEMRFLKKGKGPQPTRYQSTCIERHRCKMEAGCQCFYPAPTYQDICRPKYGSAFSQSSLYISVTAGLMRIQIGMRKCRTGLDWTGGHACSILEKNLSTHTAQHFLFISFDSDPIGSDSCSFIQLDIFII